MLVALVGDSPLRTYELLIGSALTWPDGIGYTLFYATPLLFTGLAVAVAFRCGLLNIGAEGQLTIAAFATAWAGITFAGWPAWLLIPLCFAGGGPLGGGVGGDPGRAQGALRGARGDHHDHDELHRRGPGQLLHPVPLQEGGGRRSSRRCRSAKGRTSRASGGSCPAFPERIPLNLAFPLALVVCLLVYLFLWRTRWGYEIRATGSSPAAAEYGGISTGRQIVLAMALSGGLAGMVAINEVLGYRYRYYDGFSAGYGFTGIAVALLGRNHPVGVILSSLLFGALLRGGLFVDIFTANVSKDLVQVLQAIIILFVAAEAMFRGPFGRLVRLRREAGRHEPDPDRRPAVLGRPPGDPAAPRGARRALFGALGGDQHRPRGVDAGRRVHRRRRHPLQRQPLGGAAGGGPGGDVRGADPRRRLHPLPGGPGGERHGDQHPLPGGAGAALRRALRIDRRDAADPAGGAAAAGADRPRLRPGAGDLVGALPHAVRPAPAGGGGEPGGGGHRRGRRRAPALRRRADLRAPWRRSAAPTSRSARPPSSPAT